MVTNTDTISSIDRALDILLLFYHEKRELGVTEISSLLGVYKSTVYRTLSTLESKGFIEQNPENGKYWLGLKLYALGMTAGNNMSLKKIAQPYAKEISKKFNEVVNVSVLDINDEDLPKSIIVLKEESKNQVLKVQPEIGSSSDAYCSAVGKCLLAFSTDDVMEKLKGKEFTVYTKNTIKNWEELSIEVEKIRREGYSIDDEEKEIGLTCLACPILDSKGYAVAAMSVTGPTSRMKSLNLDDVINELKIATKKIASLIN